MKKTAVSIPESIGSRTCYKRKFSFRELYSAYLYLPQAVRQLAKNNKTNALDKNFVERLQLAVTEVNGCAACSYAHTYMALKQGMSSEEIHSFLVGDGSFVKVEEAKALLFAQHFAAERGCPQRNAYEAVVQAYGAEKALVILAAVQTMLVGNIYGLPMSAFRSRLKGQPFEDSSWAYELGMQLGGLLVLPIALVHGAIRSLAGGPVVQFNAVPA